MTEKAEAESQINTVVKNMKLVSLNRTSSNASNYSNASMGSQTRKNFSDTFFNKKITIDKNSLHFTANMMKKFNVEYYSATFNGNLSNLTRSVDLTKQKAEVWVNETAFAKGGCDYLYINYL
jgi:hypothetical protein